jgi:hypothetical protein
MIASARDKAPGRIRFAIELRLPDCPARRQSNSFASRPLPPKIRQGNGAGAFSLQRDCFNPLDFFGGEREVFGLEVLFHMLLARGSGQREHSDLHGKPKDNLCGPST